MTGLSRAMITVLSILSTTAVSFGSIWENRDWALVGDGEAGIGYDSNLYARNGGVGDGYALLTPTLSLQRLHSFTDFHVDLALQSYTFFDRTGLDSLDPSLTVVVHYPFDEYLFPTQQFTLIASRSTEVNGDVGGRLRRQDFGGRWEGHIIASEKTILEGRAEVHQTDYLTAGYNDNEFATAGLTLSYVSNERLQIGAGYDYEYSVSKPKDSGAIESSFRQHLVTMRGRGEFLPKVTGYCFIGVASTDNRGSDTRSYLDLEGELSIAWQATVRGQLIFKVARETYFSPNGYAYIPTSVGPEWDQELAGGYSLRVGANEQQILYRFGTGTRNDQLYAGYFQLHYALTERFTAALTMNYTRQDSPEYIVNYTRGTLYASFTCKF
jgi:hypothetical protein